MKAFTTLILFYIIVHVAANALQVDEPVVSALYILIILLTTRSDSQNKKDQQFNSLTNYVCV